MPQNSVKKSNCPKNKTPKIPHGWISDAVGCSESIVKAVRNGQRSRNSDTGQRIEVAEILLDEGVNKLLTEVKRVVQFK